MKIGLITKESKESSARWRKPRRQKQRQMNGLQQLRKRSRNSQRQFTRERFFWTRTLTSCCGTHRWPKRRRGEVAGRVVFVELGGEGLDDDFAICNFFSVQFD